MAARWAVEVPANSPHRRHSSASSDVANALGWRSHQRWLDGRRVLGRLLPHPLLVLLRPLLQHDVRVCTTTGQRRGSALTFGWHLGRAGPAGRLGATALKWQCGKREGASLPALAAHAQARNRAWHARRSKPTNMLMSSLTRLRWGQQVGRVQQLLRCKKQMLDGVRVASIGSRAAGGAGPTPR